MKDVNSRAFTSGLMPIPVSATPMRTRPSGMGATVTETEPRAVNFTAFPTRFTTTCRNRPTSPRTWAGVDGSHVRCRPIPFADALTWNSVTAAFTAA